MENFAWTCAAQLPAASHRNVTAVTQLSLWSIPWHLDQHETSHCRAWAPSSWEKLLSYWMISTWKCWGVSPLWRSPLTWDTGRKGNKWVNILLFLSGDCFLFIRHVQASHGAEQVRLSGYTVATHASVCRDDWNGLLLVFQTCLSPFTLFCSCCPEFAPK